MTNQVTYHTAVRDFDRTALITSDDHRDLAALLKTCDESTAHGERYAHLRSVTETPEFRRHARSVGIGEDTWPYGPNIDHRSRIELVIWAQRHGLRYKRGQRCPHWLAKGRCAQRWICGFQANWADHQTSWTRGGKPAVMIAQPYGLGSDDVSSLAALVAEYQLTVRIDGTGWYGLGTTFVELWAPGIEPGPIQ